MPEEPLGTAELDQPGNKELFEQYRVGSIGPSEEIDLFQFIFTLHDKYGKKFKLRELLKPLGYTDFDFKKLDSEYVKWKRRQEKGEGIGIATQGPSAYNIAAKSKEISTGATKALMSELQELGNLLVTQFAKNASDRGESLKEYVIKCITLREEYGDSIEELQQKYDMQKIVLSMFVDVVKPEFKQLAAARMYLDWITGLIQLKALGIEVDQNVIQQVTLRLEEAMQVRVT